MRNIRLDNEIFILIDGPGILTDSPKYRGLKTREYVDLLEDHYELVTNPSLLLPPICQQVNWALASVQACINEGGDGCIAGLGVPMQKLIQFVQENVTQALNQLKGRLEQIEAI